MLLSLKWLNEFVDLSGLSTEEIEEKLVKAGFEVEAEEHLGLGTNLVVGKVLECRDHPDSDHLHVCKVDVGDEILDIVCGAPNCREGLKVIVARVGASIRAAAATSGEAEGGDGAETGSESLTTIDHDGHGRVLLQIHARLSLVRVT